MNQLTKKIISEFSPMWTNKQIWEFDQINPELTFDLIYVEPGQYDEKLWESKSVHLDSEVRDVIVRTFDNLLESLPEINVTQDIINGLNNIEGNNN